MPDMNYLFNFATPVSLDTLQKGHTYWIMAARQGLTPGNNDLRLLLKLRALPHNIFVMLPTYCTGVFNLSQINKINKEQLFVNFSYWGKLHSGEPILQIRNATIPMPTYAEMTAAGAVGY